MFQHLYIDTPEGANVAKRIIHDENKNANLVMLMETINRLEK